MPFSGGSYSRTKTFATSGTLTPADINSVQDDLGGQIMTNMIRAGISDAATVRRGKSIIATEESRTNAAYGLMTTPDRVQSIVLPTDGIIAVMYHAHWKEAVTSAAMAAIFIGANQLAVGRGSANASNQQATLTNAVANTYTNLSTTGFGLYGLDAAGTGEGTALTTGTAVAPDQTINMGGGPCYVFAAAGTYDISIQFLAASNSVTVKNRKLWVWTLGF